MSQPTPALRFSLRKPVITGMECDENVPETPPSEPAPEDQGFTPVKTKHTQRFQAIFPADHATGNSNNQKRQWMKGQLKTLVILLRAPQIISIRRSLDPKGKAVVPLPMARVRYILVEVTNERDLEKLIQGAFSPENTDSSTQDSVDSNTYTVAFERFTQDMQDHDHAFSLDIVALSVHATETDVRIACEEWGEVDQVIMGKNFKGSMSTATVTFTSADSIDTMQQGNPFMVIIGDDSGQIKRYGNNIVDHTHNIRQKLVNLPQGSTPRTVATMFQDAGYEFATITMPVTVRFGRRFREAFVTFTDEEQWDKVSGARFEAGYQKLTAWVGMNEKACYSCGSIEHKVGDCEDSRKRKEIHNDRAKNVFYQNRAHWKEEFAPIVNPTQKSYAAVTAPKKRATPSPITHTPSQVSFKTQHNTNNNGQATISAGLSVETAALDTLRQELDQIWTKKLEQLERHWVNREKKMMDEFKAMIKTILPVIAPTTTTPAQESQPDSQFQNIPSNISTFQPTNPSPVVPPSQMSQILNTQEANELVNGWKQSTPQAALDSMEGINFGSFPLSSSQQSMAGIGKIMQRKRKTDADFVKGLQTEREFLELEQRLSVAIAQLQESQLKLDSYDQFQNSPLFAQFLASQEENSEEQNEDSDL
ncbi:hypothetical protein EMPS_00121 [Entomortierella parvispora]|uniref:Uncharacterized protein n=1 Tax=Entomortierella parvispora TaxID=205924 RepID=A0A9P3GZD9_9FUNG|nr:hypothetical protein EMPS_00121 [Entomortierella parvispora]